MVKILVLFIFAAFLAILGNSHNHTNCNYGGNYDGGHDHHGHHHHTTPHHHPKHRRHKQHYFYYQEPQEEEVDANSRLNSRIQHEPRSDSQPNIHDTQPITQNTLQIGDHDLGPEPWDTASLVVTPDIHLTNPTRLDHHTPHIVRDRAQGLADFAHPFRPDLRNPNIDTPNRRFTDVSTHRNANADFPTLTPGSPYNNRLVGSQLDNFIHTPQDRFGSAHNRFRRSPTRSGVY